MRLNALTAAFAAIFLSACTGGTPAPAGDIPAAAPATKATTQASWADNRLSVQVPVPVVVLGFSAAQVTELSRALRPHTVDHGNGDFNQLLPPDLEEGGEQGLSAFMPLGGESFPNPVLPTAIYQVQAAPPALAAEFAQALDSVRIAPGLFDAIAMEDWLAAALPRHGFTLNPNAPSVVLMHLGAFGETGHGWRHQGRTGKLEPVRVFGERYPLLSIDISAKSDPYVGSGGYRSPLTPDNAGFAAAFITDATEYRLLPASIYPVSTAPCHAVTALMGVRPTSLYEVLPDLRSVEDALHTDWIAGAFENLTGGEVHFDFKLLTLPVDDPILDALARGEFPAMEVLRGWLTVMWEEYHVDHPGCEEYLSVVFAGDVATIPGGGILGIGTYDDNPGKRISMSWVAESIRLLFDPESPVCQLECDDKDYLNWWDYLFTHETGHILGQHHTHHKQNINGSVGSNSAFSSVWSTMSYQQDGRVIDLGAMDHASWIRNRAGFALMLAAEAGREGTPAWDAALAAAENLDWVGVWLALRED